MKTILFLCFGLLICLAQPASSEPVTLLTPVNGAVNVKSNNLYFSWTRGQNQVWRMWISTSLDSIVNGTAFEIHAGMAVNSEPDTGFDWAEFYGDLQEGTTYYWQVSGQGERITKSAIWHFTTAGTVSVSSIPSSIVRPVSVDARYYNVQGKLINKNSSHNIIIKQTGNMISKEVLWNCSRKTSR
jgi:hypothetical protein